MPYHHIIARIHDADLLTDPIEQGLLPLIDDRLGKRIGWIDSRNERLMSIFKRHTAHGVNINPLSKSILISTPDALSAFTKAARAVGDWPQNVAENIPVWLDQAKGEPDALINRIDLYPLGAMARGVHLICKDEDNNYLLPRRSHKVAIFKGALDVSVGGFVGEGMTPATALKEEALSEIGLDPAYIQPILSAQAPRTYEYINRTIGFPTETNGGIWHDRVYAWTVILPNDFTPEFKDGEVKELLRFTPQELIAALKVPNAVKVNSAMMLLDDLYLSGHFDRHTESKEYVENFVQPLCITCDF